MPVIILEKETMDKLRETAEPWERYVDNSVVREDGKHAVPIAEEVLERLVGMKYDNETLDDTVLRLIERKGRKQ